MREGWKVIERERDRDRKKEMTKADMCESFTFCFRSGL